MTDTDKKIAVMQAFTRGKTIECYKILGTAHPDWVITTCPSWNWSQWNYRVKPETRTIYRVAYSDGTAWQSADRQAAIERWCDAHIHGFRPTLQSFEVQNYE